MNPGIQVLIVLAATSLGGCIAQECGKAPLGNRIVGGIDAPDGAWPWQVDIHLGPSGHVCGGTLIASNWVLSAAHCFPKISEIYSYSFYVGRHKLNSYNQYESHHSAIRVVVPPDYMDPQTGRDLALVQLAEPVTWSVRVQPICLPVSGMAFSEGTLCHVTGWGDTQEGVSLSGVGTLQQVKVPIIEQNSCNSMYKVQSYYSETVDILPDMICAGFKDGGKDSCQGDSGGPLVCPAGNRTWVQAGVVSFGLGCAQPNRPGVYTKVSAFTDFIKSTVSNAQLIGGGFRREANEALVLGYSLALVLLGR
ncbi:serine protease 33 [Osmerus eperlanus]|uniref:serine protease 33 n=1 Tax=Osmerus eperlanus TaxID=29151 RepID=UPI002E15D048